MRLKIKEGGSVRSSWFVVLGSLFLVRCSVVTGFELLGRVAEYSVSCFLPPYSMASQRAIRKFISTGYRKNYATAEGR